MDGSHVRYRTRESSSREFGGASKPVYSTATQANAPLDAAARK